MGAANIRRSLSPLHTQVETLLWAMRCMIGADNQDVAFFTDCTDLVKIVSSPTEWSTFSAYMEDFQSDREEFTSFSLFLISRSANVKADNLVRKVRTQPLHITYINNILQNWFVWVLNKIRWQKKKKKKINWPDSIFKSEHVHHTSCRTDY